MFPYLAFNLRRIRRELELSQLALAERTGLTQPYISSLERGLRPTDPAHITLLANALQVTEGALLKRPRRYPAIARLVAPCGDPSFVSAVQEGGVR